MKKIDSSELASINFIASPIVYLLILLPLINFFKLDVKLIPIAMIIHAILFWILCIYLEKKQF